LAEIAIQKKTRLAVPLMKPYRGLCEEPGVDRVKNEPESDSEFIQSLKDPRDGMRDELTLPWRTPTMDEKPGMLNQTLTLNLLTLMMKVK
jgi:hypothetical protein